MNQPTKRGPRAYLKKLGFQFDKKPPALDRAFLKSLPTDERDEVEDIWMRLHSGLGHISELYAVPKTEKQAALLFSHDAARMLATMSWFSDVVDRLQPRTVLDAGCGAGYLLRYLHARHPDVRFSGIDRQENLVAIAAADTELNLHASSFDEVEFRDSFDLIISDFGWDNQDIPTSSNPHSSAEIAGAPYCPGCSDDQVPFFFALLDRFRIWLSDDGQMAIVGRFPHVGAIRAFYIAAESCGLCVQPGGFEVLKVATSAGVERFPAFLIAKQNTATGSLPLESIAAAYTGNSHTDAMTVQNGGN